MTWVVLLDAKSVSGKVVVGPFDLHDDAYRFAESTSGDYHIQTVWPASALE